MTFNPNKPDCQDCNRPPHEQWIHAYDPYGHRCMDVCRPCQDKRQEEQERREIQQLLAGRVVQVRLPN